MATVVNSKQNYNMDLNYYQFWSQVNKLNNLNKPHEDRMLYVDLR